MEAPERKKLKSTYKPPPGVTPLAPGWTEHTAPTGHKYYYNSQTKQSTYTRPSLPVEQPIPATASPSPAPFPASAHTSFTPQYNNGYTTHTSYQDPQSFNQPSRDYRNPIFDHHQSRRGPPEDRPKRKAILTDCAPWILIYTKLGRRFVHNTETLESFWKFPDHVMKAVIEHDRVELERKLAKSQDGGGTGANKVPVAERSTRQRRSASLQREDEEALAAELAAADEAVNEAGPIAQPESRPATTAQEGEEGDSSSEYEEVEVTDSEDESNAPATSTNPEAENIGPVEFNEEDIAYQLAAMNDSYSLDPADYGPDADEGLPLSISEAQALFSELLSSHNINPYAPFPALLENLPLITDERWTILPTTSARKEAWDIWTRSTIAALKSQREKEEKVDPRIAYQSLLSEKASTKLYWPEFKRKFKREAALRDQGPKFTEKEREKLYRDFVTRLRLPLQKQKSDLGGLLREQPLRDLHRDSEPDSLPTAVLVDARFWSLPARVRGELVEAYILTLPSYSSNDSDKEESAEAKVEREKRQKREEALRERERAVAEEKRRRERDIRMAEGRLREREEEIKSAMRVDSRRRLMEQLHDGGREDEQKEGGE